MADASDLWMWGRKKGGSAADVGDWNPKPWATTPPTSLTMSCRTFPLHRRAAWRVVQVYQASQAIFHLLFLKRLRETTKLRKETKLGKEDKLRKKARLKKKIRLGKN